MITLSFDLVNSSIDEIKAFAPNVYKHYPCIFVRYNEIFIGHLKWSVVLEDFEIYSNSGNCYRQEVQEVRLIMME